MCSPAWGGGHGGAVGRVERLEADGRKLAVEALGKGHDPEAIAVLEAALEDHDDNVRQGAMEAVTTLGAVARERAEELLLGRLFDRDPVVRLTALEGLTTLGVAIPWTSLSPLLDDATLHAPALAAAALTESPEAPRALARALASARGTAFDIALKGLSRMGEGLMAARVAEAVADAGPEPPTAW